MSLRMMNKPGAESLIGSSKESTDCARLSQSDAHRISAFKFLEIT
jgi:hypothetical protein